MLKSIKRTRKRRLYWHGGIGIFDAQEKAIKYKLYRSGLPIDALYTIDKKTLAALSSGFGTYITIWKRVI